MPADHGLGAHHHESASPARPQAREGDPEGAIEGGEPWPAVSMGVDRELLTEGQLDDGLALAAPDEGQGAAQYGSDEAEQRPKHRPILIAAGAEWEPESRAAVGLSSTDSEIEAGET
jgi:hypothetical protein